ncbi:hypothetical protein EV359DRAFT_86403 [Lentinula novae-zelandiae]|nr:hypothetical protein EV359DRAFT_86403 [Lentinula novae-zelandiae]
MSFIVLCSSPSGLIAYQLTHHTTPSFHFHLLQLRLFSSNTTPSPNALVETVGTSTSTPHRRTHLQRYVRNFSQATTTTKTTPLQHPASNASPIATTTTSPIPLAPVTQAKTKIEAGWMLDTNCYSEGSPGPGITRVGFAGGKSILPPSYFPPENSTPPTTPTIPGFSPNLPTGASPPTYALPS